MPKEIDRYRLTSGLEKFAQESKGKTPFQQAIDFYKIPGATAEMGYTLFPLLQKEAQMQGPSGDVTPKEQITQPQKRPSGPPNVKVTDSYYEPEVKAGQVAPIETLEDTQAYLTAFERMSEDDITSLARDRWNQDPRAFENLDQAKDSIRRDIETQKENLRERQAVALKKAEVDKEIRGGVEKRLKDTKYDQSIPGTLQQKLFDRAAADFARPDNKLSKTQIVSKYGDIGKRLGGALTDLDTRANSLYFVTARDPNKVVDTIEAVRKPFEEAGGLEEFSDLLESRFGTTPEGSKLFAFPYWKNKQVGKYIDSIQSPSINKYNIPDQKDLKKKSSSAADYLWDKIDTSPNSQDSLLSIAMGLKNKGLDPKFFLDVIRDKVKHGLFTPNNMQTKELGIGISFWPSIGDVSLFGSSAFEKLMEPSDVTENTSIAQ